MRQLIEEEEGILIWRTNQKENKKKGAAKSTVWHVREREEESSGKLINTKCPGRPKSETKLYDHSFEVGLALLTNLQDSAEVSEMTAHDRQSGAGSHDGTTTDECRRTRNCEVLYLLLRLSQESAAATDRCSAQTRNNPQPSTFLAAVI